MKKNAIKTIVLGAVSVAGLALFAGSAQADTRVRIHTPQVSVSFGGHDVHVHRDIHHHQKKYHKPKHVCRYEQRPADRHYIDDCGRIVHYTEFVKVRVCESYHRPRPVQVHRNRVVHEEVRYYRDRHSDRHYDERYVKRERDRDYDDHRESRNHKSRRKH